MDKPSGEQDRRVLFCNHEVQMILLHGFIKKSQENGESRSPAGDQVSEQQRWDVPRHRDEATLEQFFDDDLKEQGVYESTTEQTVQRVLAFQVAEAITLRRHFQGANDRARLRSSRSELDCMLDSWLAGVTVDVLARAAKEVGRELRLELV